MYHYYEVYGLVFRSSIILPLPELDPKSDSISFDVDLFTGQLPDKKGKSLFKINQIPNQFYSEIFSSSDDTFEIYDEHPSGIASWVDRGKTVILTPNTDLEGNFIHLNFFLYTTLISVIFTKGNLFPFHASVVSVETGALLFLGDKGAGKSTLTLEFLQEGALFLADDILLLEKKGGCYYALPSTPYLKINADIFHKIELNVKNRIFEKYFFLSDQGKYLCKVNFKMYRNQPIKVDTIFQLIAIDHQETSMERIDQLTKISLLIKNPARPAGLDLYGKKREFMQYCFSFTDLENLNFKKIVRPCNKSALSMIKRR